MKKIRVFLVIFSILIINIINAQQNSFIQGQVFDKENLRYIPYASIYIENTSYATYCNEMGIFEINIPKNLLDKNIIISCIGYQDFVINTQKSEKYLKIYLTPSITMLPSANIILNEKKILKKALTKYNQKKQENVKISTFFRSITEKNDYEYPEIRNNITMVETNVDFYLKNIYQYKQFSLESLAQIKSIFINSRIFDGVHPNSSLHSFSNTNSGVLIHHLFYKLYDVLSVKNNKKYTFVLDTLLNSNNKEVYIFSFKSKEKLKHIPVETGKIWISDIYDVEKLLINEVKLYKDEVESEITDTIIKTTEIVYVNNIPKYAKYYSNVKEKIDNTAISNRTSKSELFINYIDNKVNNNDFEPKLKMFDGVIDYLNIQDTIIRKGNYNQIPNNDWIDKFLINKEDYFSNENSKDTILFVINKTSKICQEMKNLHYSIEYKSNFKKNKSKKYNVLDTTIKGYCFLEKSIYGIGGAKFITNDYQKKIIHLIQNTYLLKSDTLYKIKLWDDKEDNSDYVYTNKILFPPLHKSTLYFNELKRLTQLLKFDNLKKEIIENKNCYVITIHYPANIHKNIIAEKETIWIDEKNFIPIKLHLETTFKNKKIEYQTYTIKNIDYNLVDFEKKFNAENNIKLSNPITIKKRTSEEIIKKSKLSETKKRKLQRFFNKIKGK